MVCFSDNNVYFLISKKLYNATMLIFSGKGNFALPSFLYNQWPQTYIVYVVFYISAVAM